MVEKRRADYKSPGGKLVRVLVEEEDGIIKNAEITGDFFLLPEDQLPRLESMLQGKRNDEPTIRGVVSRFFESGVQGLGVSADDLTIALVSATKLEEES